MKCAVERGQAETAAFAGPLAASLPGPDDHPVIAFDPMGWRACYPALAEYVGAGGKERDTIVSIVQPADEQFVPGQSGSALQRWIRFIGYKAGEPARSRLLLAVSSDGVHWQKTGLVLANHAAVPAFAIEDGVLYLFFNASANELRLIGPHPPAVGPGSSPICVAYTTDLVRWTYRVLGHVPDGIAVNVSKLPIGTSAEAHDPCVTPRAEGGWWLFYTLHWMQATGLPHPAPAEERRGATFVAEAARLDAFHWDQNRTLPVFPDKALDCDWSAPTAACDSAEDPSVELVRSAGAGTVGYQYIAGRIPAPGRQPEDTNWLVRLKSDLSVESSASVAPTCGGGEFKLSNPLATEGTDGVAMPWYGFQAEPGTRTYIVAAEVTSSVGGGQGTITDGVDGTASGCAPALVADRSYEGTGVKDPAVIRFGDCYVMAYTTDIPGGWGPGAVGKFP